MRRGSCYPLETLATIERRAVAVEDIQPTDKYIGLEHIGSDGHISEQAEVEPTSLRSGKFRFDERHVLFGKLRPYLSKIALPDFTGICSTDILPILPGPQLDRAFLFHYLRTPQVVHQTSSLATGANLPRISPKALASLPIPLPPLEEQRRIAAILDSADALRVKRRHAIAKLDSLTQAIFIDMFGTVDGATTQYGFVKLSDVGQMANGMNFTSSDRGDGNRGVKMLDVKNMYTAGISPALGEAYRVNIDAPVSKLLSPGDLIFVRSSVKREGVAWPALFTGYHEPVAYCGFIIRCRLNPEMQKRFLPEFLVHYLRQVEVRMMAVASAGQVAITNVNQRRLGELPVPLVPISVQSEFQKRLADLSTNRSNCLLHQTKLDSLFASLQQRAFRGEL